MRDGLIGRGTEARTAALLAETSVTLLYVALEEWLDKDDDRALFDVVLDTLKSLQTVLASFPAGPSVRHHDNSPSGRTQAVT
jgi:hypothetical protein